MMGLERFLAEDKPALSKAWFDLIIGTYPPETSALLQKDKNQFSNPVGYTVSQGVSGIIDEMLGDFDRDKVLPLLDQMVRIRAIQDFSPAQAVGFVFLLKKIVRNLAEEGIREKTVSPQDVLAFESKIDELALMAFNAYVSCREKLYELRVNEVKNRTFRLLQRANLIAEIPDHEPHFKNGQDPIT